MKSITVDIPRLMLELLDQVGEEEHPKFTRRAVEIIDEIADYAKTKSIFCDAKQRGEAMFTEGTKAEQLYYHMLGKVVYAPSAFYRDASVLMMMPFLQRAVHEEYGQEAKDEEEVGENDGQAGEV